jgi:hypothetical protein
MDDGMMMMDVPGWLTALSWVFVAVTVICAAMLAFDIFARGRHQATRTMDVVWPVSALYLGPLALLLYARWGRQHSTPPLAAGGLAGGAASALAHLVGVPLVVLTGLTIAGIDLWPMILVIAVIAPPCSPASRRSPDAAWAPRSPWRWSPCWRSTSGWAAGCCCCTSPRACPRPRRSPSGS